MSRAKDVKLKKRPTNAPSYSPIAFRYHMTVLSSNFEACKSSPPSIICPIVRHGLGHELESQFMLMFALGQSVPILYFVKNCKSREKFITQKNKLHQKKTTNDSASSKISITKIAKSGQNFSRVVIVNFINHCCYDFNIGKAVAYS